MPNILTNVRMTLGDLLDSGSELLFCSPLDRSIARQKVFRVGGCHTVVEAFPFRLWVGVAPFQHPPLGTVGRCEQQSQFPHVPPVEVLDYMNPDLSDDSIRRHLQQLLEVGVVEEYAFPTGERLRAFPHKFYGLTTEARELFERNNLFPERAWQRQYASVEKTPRIRQVQEMPRPELV